MFHTGVLFNYGCGKMEAEGPRASAPDRGTAAEAGLSADPGSAASARRGTPVGRGG